MYGSAKSVMSVRVAPQPFEVANKEGVKWHLITPVIGSFLKDFYSKDYVVKETYRLNPYGVRHRFIDVYNYPSKS